MVFSSPLKSQQQRCDEFPLSKWRGEYDDQRERERERGHGDDEAAGVVAATGCELAASDDGGEADARRVVVVARARWPLAAVAASRAGDAVAAFVLHP